MQKLIKLLLLVGTAVPFSFAKAEYPSGQYCSETQNGLLLCCRYDVSLGDWICEDPENPLPLPQPPIPDQSGYY